jgi:site-specific DNA-adenine methylase
MWTMLKAFYRALGDHIRLADFLFNLHNKGVNWLLLDYDTPEIRQLYRDFQIFPILRETHP